MKLTLKAKGKKQKARSLGIGAWSFQVSNASFDCFALSKPFPGLRSPVSGLLTCFLVSGLLLASCHTGTQKTVPAIKSDESGIAAFAFSEEMHNFGSLNAGEIVSYTFVFRNSGNKTLVINRIDSGCGCMEVKIPEMSVEPGDEGRVEVIYNSAGEVGNQLKTITLFSNADHPEKQLFIRASVKNEMIEIYS